jgi:hypothetical protein
MERGTVHLFGSTYQQRRGFMHRSISDVEYPNPNGVWDVENDLCGGPSGSPVTDPVLGFTMQGINAPNTTIGTAVGYSTKDYHNDTRLRFDTFTFNPFGLGMRYKYSNNGENWGLQYFKSLNEPVVNKNLQIRNGRTAMHLNNHLVWRDTPENDLTELEMNFSIDEKLKNLFITNDNQLLLQVDKYNETMPDSVSLVKLNPADNSAMVQFSLPVISNINSLSGLTGGMPCFANLEADGRIRFYLPDLGGNMQSFAIWNPQIAELASLQIDLEKSKLIILSGNADSVYVLFSLTNLNGSNSNLYYAKGLLEYTHNQDITEPVLQVSTKVYPNPFKQNMTLRIETNKTVKADLAIYNIKGQKVINICTGSTLSKGEHSLGWSGADSIGKPVSNGVYFLRGTVGAKPVMEKLLLLK